MMDESIYKALENSVEVVVLEDNTKNIKLKYYFLKSISHVFEVGENNKNPATGRSRKLIRRLIKKERLVEFQQQMEKEIANGCLVVMNPEEVEQLKSK